MKKTALALIALAATVGIAHAGEKENSHRERPSKADRFIEAADLDNDRAVTKEEYKAFLVKKAETHFGKIDTNGDGSVSKDEFLAGPSGEELTSRTFDRFDVNKDGKIDLADKVEAGQRIKKRHAEQTTPTQPGELDAESKSTAE